MGQEYQRNVNVISTVAINSQPWFFDGFEGVFDWYNFTKTNASATVSQVTTEAYEGSKSMKITTGATAPATNNRFLLGKNIVYPGNRYIEIVMTAKIEQPAFVERLILWATTTIRAIDWYYGLAFNTSTGRIERANGFLTWTDISSGTIYQNEDGWNYLKLTLDTLTNKYVRAQINENVIDLRSISAATGGGNGTAGIAIAVGIQTLDNVNRTAYFDNISMKGLDSI